MDLTRPVTIYRADLGNVELNDAATLSGGVIRGCAVDSADWSAVAVRQYLPPLAKGDGLDVGGVWLDTRQFVLKGTLYGQTRDDAYTILAAKQAALQPISNTLGTSTLTFWLASVPVAYSIWWTVRPNGLRMVDRRYQQGGEDAEPLAIPWECTFLARPNRNML